MRSTSEPTSGLLVLALLVATLVAGPGRAEAAGTVVIPVAPGGIGYYEPLEDEEPYGPTALAVDADGGVA